MCSDKRFFKTRLGFSTILCLCCVPLHLFAVEGQGEAEGVSVQNLQGEETSGEKVKEKAGGTGDEGTFPNQESGESTKIPAPKNSPLVTEPKNAAELMEAISLTLDISRLDATKIYLQQFLELKLDDGELSQLRRSHGPSLFLRLSNIEALQPESVQLLERTNRAFAKQVGDPEEIRRRILELQQDSDTREAAFAELRGAGTLVLPGIVNAYYASDDPKLRETLAGLMIAVGRPGVRPLVGALESDSPQLSLAAIRALEVFGDRRTAEHLWYYSAAPSQPEAVRVAARNAIKRLTPGGPETSTVAVEELRRLIRKYSRGDMVNDDDAEDESVVWSWDSQSMTIVPRTMSPHEAGLLMALKLSKQALQLAPHDEELQCLSMTEKLDREIKDEGGVYTLVEGRGTAYEEGLQAGAEKISRVLETALEDRRIKAAVAACRILGKLGSPRTLQPRSGKSAPLIRGLNHPDPRIQYEAAQAIVQCNPSSKFPSSLRVVQILGRAMVSEETSSWRALIVDPSVDRGTGLMGMVRALGAESHLVTTGREAFESACSGAPPDFLLLNIAVSHWNLTETLANLRQDVRTTNIPVVLYGAPQADQVIENRASDIVLDENLPMSDRLKALEDLHSRVRSSGGMMDKQRLRKLSDLTDRTIEKRQLFANKSAEAVEESARKALEAKESKQEIIGKEKLIDEKRRLRKQYATDRALDRQLEVGLHELMGDLVVRSVRTPGQSVLPETRQRPDNIRQKYQRELEGNSSLFYIEEPQSPEDLQAQIRPFEAKLRSLGMTPPERQRQARLAAVSLVEIGRGKLSEILPLAPAESSLLQASHNPEIMSDVLDAMSFLPTESIQNRLAEMILNQGIEVGLRTKATGHLLSQVNRVGSHLRPEVVRRLVTLAETETDEKLQSTLQGLMGVLNPGVSRRGP